MARSQSMTWWARLGGAFAEHDVVDVVASVALGGALAEHGMVDLAASVAMGDALAERDVLDIRLRRLGRHTR